MTGFLLRRCCCPPRHDSPAGGVLWRALAVFDGIDKAHHETMPGAHLYVRTVSVHPEHQGKGVGGALLEFIADLADAYSLPAYLECIGDKNECFYDKKGGFKVERRTPVEHGDRVLSLNGGVAHMVRPSKAAADGKEAGMAAEASGGQRHRFPGLAKAGSFSAALDRRSSLRSQDRQQVINTQMVKVEDAATAEQRVAFDEQHYPKGLNANFLQGDAEQIVTDHIARFEDPEKRDIAKAAPNIIEMLIEVAGLDKTKDVADVGAGTGLLVELIAEKAKSVLANEISPAFVENLKNRVESKGLSNVTVITGTPEDPCLPQGSVDVVLVCDVYHHFEYPVTTCKHIKSALRPGGRLVVIDFIRDDEVHKSHPPGWILQHVRAGQAEFRAEILSAGFKLVAEPAVKGLDENYCMVFGLQGLFG